ISRTIPRALSIVPFGVFSLDTQPQFPRDPPMSASPAQIAANKANSLKSCGPKSPETKQRSRANARKHGLTGDGIALSTEDADAVKHRFAALQAELSTAGALGIALVGQIALFLVRLERCALHESA